MADDGMFLNFAADENSTPSTNASQKFKGGSWRDRLKAKRAQRAGSVREGLHRANNANSVPISSDRRSDPERRRKEPLGEEFQDYRPAKRRRENGPSQESSEGSATRQKRHPPSSGPREVISSLFTYNPKPTTTPEERAAPKEEDKPATPTNAPLLDGIDTFMSLGLSPTISAHLLTKMKLTAPTAIQKAAIRQMLDDPGDAFIQSETGSGKTLAYLLPLVQRLMTLSEQIRAGREEDSQNPMIHRDSGLFAIVLAPTRELCKQISVVLERLLGCARYIVAGHVLGGEKKKSEKARLRKGLNILVATPGRLVDHLDNTKALDVSNVRWLILDEGDRLMDMGFEEDITKIVITLDQRKALRETRGHVQWPGLPTKRTTVLCSATLKMNVQKLGEISLKNAMLIKGDASGSDERQEGDPADDAAVEGLGKVESSFLAPAQLKQSYIVAAAKLRFVTLTAFLKRTFARKGSVMKAIVFLSCADSVEFHFKIFTANLESEKEANGVGRLQSPTGKDETSSDTEADPDATQKVTTSTTTKSTIATESPSHAPSPILSNTQSPLTLYKLHGSLPQKTRTETITQFTKATTPSLLLATDVASRGLDLPNLDLVIEYDPAFSAEDHLHRIGRTARLGRDGRAIIFLLPGKEEGYVSVLKSSYREAKENMSNVSHFSAEDVLKRGFAPTSGVLPTKSKSSTKNGTSATAAKGTWDDLATNLQLALERYVLSSPALQTLARKAFQSHIRAYATHTADERKYFDIKELHLGHLCKSFGLRDTPSGIGAGRAGSGAKGRHGANAEKRKRNGDDGDVLEAHETDEAARKMREKVKLNRKMMMGGGGADEFNIA
jgi:ATP-dependent RNA helicase DDX31/DBP7